MIDIAAEIQAFVARSDANRFPDDGLPYFDIPLVGCAAAGDPLFRSYREVIGSFYLTPDEFLPAAASVIVWILPISAKVRESNAAEKIYPSRQWAWTRSRGEALNVLLRKHVVSLLESRGCMAVAPQLSPLWWTVEEGQGGIASTWSERHAAYAAGLGTFSLNDALITEAGIAHRCGSVITDLVLAPTPRRYRDYRENCLYFNGGKCGACIRRCPVGALGTTGHDKQICKAYVYGGVPDAVSEEYGVTETGCGLCQTAVPCEGRIPHRKD